MGKKNYSVNRAITNYLLKKKITITLVTSMNIRGRTPELCRLKWSGLVVSARLCSESSDAFVQYKKFFSFYYFILNGLLWSIIKIYYLKTQFYLIERMHFHEYTTIRIRDTYNVFFFLMISNFINTPTSKCELHFDIILELRNYIFMSFNNTHICIYRNRY